MSNSPYTIGGRVWHDRNGNGIQDDGPPPLPAEVSWTFDYDEEGRSRARSEPVFFGSGVVAGPGLFSLGLTPLGSMRSIPLIGGQGKTYHDRGQPLTVGANAFYS
jgi:hypothetical protein